MAYADRRPKHSDSESDEESGYDIHGARWRRSFLTIGSLDDIKEVYCVSSFRCVLGQRTRHKEVNGIRSFEPASLARLATKMPRLEWIHWFLGPDERWSRFIHAGQQRRYEFGKSLFQLPTQYLTQFYLQMGDMEPNNHSWQNASALHISDPETDWLSLGLHHVSQASNLRFLVLEGPIVLSPPVLWPGAILDNLTTESNTADYVKSPYWPSLKRFSIRTSAISPDGLWLFDGVASERPGSIFLDSDEFIEIASDSDESVTLSEKIEEMESGNLPTGCFRDTLRTTQFEAWIKAMVLATRRMPKLRSGIFTISTRWWLGEGNANDFRVDVEYGVNTEDVYGWIFRMGRDLKYNLDPELLQFIKREADRNVNIEITSEKRE